MLHLFSGMGRVCVSRPSLITINEGKGSTPLALCHALLQTELREHPGKLTLTALLRAHPHTIGAGPLC